MLLNRVLSVNPEIRINSDMQQNSKIPSTKILTELARKDRATSPLLNLVKMMNNIRSSKIVWIPKGIGNSLTTYTQNAKKILTIKILFHFKGILAITNAKITTAVCSGIPCKIKAINGIFIDLTTSPITHNRSFLQSHKHPTILLQFQLLHTSRANLHESCLTRKYSIDLESNYLLTWLLQFKDSKRMVALFSDNGATILAFISLNTHDNQIKIISGSTVCRHTKSPKALQRKG
jgi:hypothetical protein